MNKIYNLIVTEQAGTRVLYDGAIPEAELKDRLAKIAPECNVNWKMILEDKRCRYFQHYMPADVTVTQHSYKRRNELHKSGNIVKVYISEH